MTKRTEAPADVTSAPAESSTSPPTPAATSWHTAIRIGIGLSLLVGVLITAFAWPAANTEPRDVPLAVAGPPEAVAQVEQQLNAAVPDGFDLEPVADAAEAQGLIEDREVYGAIVLTPDGPPHVLTASAASPAVAQVVQAIAAQMTSGPEGAPQAPIEDVVPLPDDDPRGAGFSAAALPMVMGGMIVGIALSFAVAGVWRRVAGGAIAAIGGGLVAALVVQPWLGTLEGNYLANASVIALTIAAIAFTLIGLNALIGPAGIGLGAAVIFLLGNPLSGVTSAPEMLPTGWGALGQLLPPGAGGNLLRSTSFFDGAAAGGPVLVLSTWIVLGVALAAIGHARRPAAQVARI
ncbi:ABC transporter permease [Phytoactinopolyspora mesophila]|uniref:ABC transporter permease n=1 Tax=Phytoactinopolyspora mesophila TaxID=2650750 RepID=UPI0016527399|nr:ABC transporter permease [Phytoactinopolyspora mesophila]